MPSIHLLDIEAAINWWRQEKPSIDGISACDEVIALAVPYAKMVYYKAKHIQAQELDRQAMQAWLVWAQAMPDTPCIAICSTSQGDNICKGCGRTDHEILQWPQLTLIEKRATWRRITLENKAWRFNRYAERAAEAGRSKLKQG